MLVLQGRAHRGIVAAYLSPRAAHHTGTQALLNCIICPSLPCRHHPPLVAHHNLVDAGQHDLLVLRGDARHCLKLRADLGRGAGMCSAEVCGAVWLFSWCARPFRDRHARAKVVCTCESVPNPSAALLLHLCLGGGGLQVDGHLLAARQVVGDDLHLGACEKSGGRAGRCSVAGLGWQPTATTVLECNAPT